MQWAGRKICTSGKHFLKEIACQPACEQPTPKAPLSPRSIG
jgi:hypothetical protein